MTKFLTTAFVGIVVFSSSCSKDEPHLQGANMQFDETKSGLVTDSVCNVNGRGDIIQQSGISSMMSSNEAIEPFADSPITVVGYTSKEYMDSEVMVFSQQPVDNRLSPFTYYIQDYYTYIYRITVPHGATITIPNASQISDTWPTGMNPDNQSLPGYKVDFISGGANGDVYEFSTIIREISYNASGQYLGFTAYLPFRVGNPATDLIWKYTVSDTDWSLR